MRKYATGKLALAICDVCGQKYKKKNLRELIVRGHKTNVLACRTCFDGDHPQNFVGLYPVHDPQAIRRARPDTTYTVAGDDTEGSRQIQWGWGPVGFDDPLELFSFNRMVGYAELGTVTVSGPTGLTLPGLIGVLDSDGNVFYVADDTVRDSDANTSDVGITVLDSDGNSFTVGT